MNTLPQLLEQRSGLVSRMTEAHANDNTDAFTAAETELRTLDEKIARARKVEALERSEPGRPINGDAKLDAEIRGKFSLCRAIAGRFDNTVDDGFEREVQGELAKRAGRPAEGFYIPTEIFETRVLTSSAGAELIATDQRPDLYISALTNSSIVRSLGATVLDGLVGNVSIPRETASPTIGWVAENAALSSSDADFDAVTLSPKHAGAMTEYSRNMLLQSSPAVEQLLRNMLARNLALAIDAAAIKGGGSNEPTGILTTSGIQTQAAGTLYHGDLTAEMIGKADIANVAARRSFLTTPGMRKTLLKEKDGNGMYIPMNVITHGEPIAFSNQVPTTLGSGSDHGFLYGDFSELLIGIWSQVDILVNPYEATAYSKGNVKLRAMATVDCALRHPAAFVSATGVQPA